MIECMRTPTLGRDERTFIFIIFIGSLLEQMEVFIRKLRVYLYLALAQRFKYANAPL